MLVLLCSFFMFGCSTESEDAVNSTDIVVGDNTIEKVKTSTELSSTKPNLNSYFALIDPGGLINYNVSNVQIVRIYFLQA